MDSLYPLAQDGNTALKTCTKCRLSFPATTEYFPSSKSGLKAACKQCRDKYNAAYSAAHRKEISEQRKIYYAEHRDHLKEYSANYRLEHKEETRQSQTRYNHSNARKQSKARYRAPHQQQIKQYRATWHQEHREEQRQYCVLYNAIHHEERSRYSRKRRVTHRDLINARYRQYRRTERGRLLHRAHENNRRARKLTLPGTLTPQQIQDKLKLQKYRCYYAACGYAKFQQIDGKYIYHIEHTIPMSRTDANPQHDINYVVLACPSCNLKKGDKLPHEWPEGGKLL